MQILQEMFPTTPNETIRSLRTENTMNQVIDILVSQQEKNKPITLSALLIRHASEIMDGNENVLKTNRHVLWNKAKVFFIKEQLPTDLC